MFSVVRTSVRMFLLKNSSLVKWGQKFGLMRTHSQWHSCGTYLLILFGLQPLTPEICFGRSLFLSSFLSIPLFSLSEVFHHLNWQALLRPSRLHPCTPTFLSNIPSNLVQHDKKMVNINLGVIFPLDIWNWARNKVYYKITGNFPKF